MNVSKKTISPFREGSIENKEMPVIAIPVVTYTHKTYGRTHKHSRAQLIYPNSGLVKVKTNYGIWLISPLQAAWIPSEHKHQLEYQSNTEVYCLFVDRNFCNALNQKCCVFNIDGFVIELIKKAIKIGSDYKTNSHEFRIMQVLIDELSTMSPSRLNLPLASDERVLRVMELLIKNPSSNKKMDYFSKKACTGIKNLNRLFLKETGLTFGNWRKLLIILESIEMLSKGTSVTEVSIELGYKSLSSFISMFRKVTGKTPGAITDNF